MKDKVNLGIYFTLGDAGGLPESVAALQGAAEGGARLLEVGLPFSDPLLDGPVIQSSHVRAVALQNWSWKDLCQALEELKKTKALVSVMSSIQLLYHEERRRLLPSVDGILVTDLSHDRPCPFSLPSPRVWFLAPDLVLSQDFQHPPENISMCYLTRVQGITGAGQDAQGTLQKAVTLLRAKVSVPVWLGFGITQKSDLIEQAAYADGGIIGSKFVADVHRFCETKKTPAQIRVFARDWVQAFLG